MAVNLSKVLNIEKEESGMVALLLLQSVFIGIFAGALDVGANALFLERFSADLIPRAFMFSGIAGILLTSAYSFFQSRVGFKQFAVFNLVFVVLATAALRFGFEITSSKWIVFLVFVMMGPLTIVTMLGFWGTAGRFFTLRQGKRLFGVIDMGQILGMILAFYAVPLLLRFSFRVLDTLLIGLVSVVLALILQIIIGRRFSFIPVAETRKEVRKTGFLDLFKRKYTALMAVFVMLSVITAFFLHYSFLWVTEANYPESRDAASFLGAFMGTLMIFTIVIKSFLYGWLMKTYGLRIALLLSPVMVLLLTLAATIIGGFYGYSAEAGSFTLFFLIIALSKLFNKALKDAMEVPSMKILYQSLDSRERYDIQARIDGTVNEITAFSAGVIMAGLMMLSFVRIIHFTYILIVVLVLWVVVAIALYRKYRQSLEQSLVDARKGSAEAENIRFFEKNISIGSLSDPGNISVNPYFYHISSRKQIEDFLFSGESAVRKAAWQLIGRTLFRPDPEKTRLLLKTERDPEILEVAGRLGQRTLPEMKDLARAFRSADRERIISALDLVTELKDKSHLPQIITLLRDVDPVVRNAAIEAAGRINAGELGGYLVDYLGHQELGFTAWSSLVHIGEEVLENLENAFHRTGQTAEVQMRIVYAMSAIGGKKAEHFLAAKIAYHQREVRRAAAGMLYDMGFQPEASEQQMLLEAIYDVVAAGAWNLAAEQTIRENDPGNGLLEALREEYRYNNELLFIFLALAYDRQVVDHVRNTLSSEESDDTGYAIELLNMVVDDQVKEYLEPYFDDRSVFEKIRMLQNQFPVEILSYKRLLTEILSRDGLWIGEYTRACAIDAILADESFEAGLHLAAQCFHPQAVISDLSLKAIQLKAPEDWADLSRRVDKVRGVENPEENDRLNWTVHPVLERMRELMKWSLFAQVPSDELFLLAGKIEKWKKPVNESTKNVTFFRDLSTFEGNASSETVLLPTEDRSEFDLSEKNGRIEDGAAFMISLDNLRALIFSYRGIHAAFMALFERELQTI